MPKSKKKQPFTKEMSTQEAYRLAFLQAGNQLTPPAERVIKDLMAFCFAEPYVSTFSQSSKEMARRVGRREVYERVISILYQDAVAGYDPDSNDSLVLHTNNEFGGGDW